MKHATDTLAYGTATLSPTSDVTTGSYNTWTITYSVGELGMDDGSTLKIAWSQTSDWGTPQFTEPTADNYATVETSGSATVSATYDSDGYERPWKSTVKIGVTDGSLEPDDTITLTLGATSGGSLGHQAQSYVETDFELFVLVDPVRTGEFLRLPEPLTFDIVAGRADRMEVVVPSTVEPDEPVTVSVRVEDFWGNVATGFDGAVELTSEGGGEHPETVEVSNGVGQVETTFTEDGVHRLSLAYPERDLSAVTNPIVVGDHEMRTYWGDIHGQSGETVGTGTIQQYFEYARDAAFLDFTSHAGNDFQITDWFWDEIQETIRAFHDPDEFVTFLCYEWSANTPAGGDHNVYFRGDEAEIQRSSQWQTEEGAAKMGGINHIEDLYDHYRGRDDVLIIPHQGGRPSTLADFDPDLTPFVEITSVWGVFEWLGHRGLDRGYQIGFVGGSDDHTGRPGVGHPDNLSKHNVRGGLMAARTSDLDRDSLWDAFTSKRVYATTGARILLDVSIDGAGMGESVTVDGAPTVEASVRGTAPVQRIDLFRGSEQIATESFADGNDLLELTFSGAKGRGRDKVVDWSGGLTLDRGEIGDVLEFGFDHPRQGIVDRTDTWLRWDATTTGGYEGFRIDIDAPEDATVAVRTPALSHSFRLDEITEERVDAGGLDAALTLRRTGVSTEHDVDVTFTDDSPPRGTRPYYVRVHQTDGDMAWSTPIFVNSTDD
ncbi:DUF3604 domain-containing protein [Haloarchaeobius sp. TZWSO28]|uniref:DUF3604 domain-containing protein n=1 Tax=Haloarchaeobius sp. TZWSO28 TaxID=3446119 RepID=UPI003EB9ED41